MERKLVVFVLTTFSLICNVVFADDSVNAIPGTHSVSPNGAANYSIPIDVPPGINGMQPSISLNYSSDLGNGLMGLRWGLSAGSVISRCATNLTDDGFVDPVDYDENDQFCLDGVRLVYDSQNGVYKLPDRSSTEIEPISQYGNGPDYFVVRSNGVESIYGENLFAKQLAVVNGKFEVYSWHIDSTTDKFSNSIKYYYSVYYGRPWDPASHGYLPNFVKIEKIEYSDYEIDFVYQHRVDRVIKKYASTRIQIDSRIKNIIVSNLGDQGTNEEIKKYQLNYESLLSHSLTKSHFQIN